MINTVFSEEINIKPEYTVPAFLAQYIPKNGYKAKEVTSDKITISKSTLSVVAMALIVISVFIGGLATSYKYTNTINTMTVQHNSIISELDQQLAINEKALITLTNNNADLNNTVVSLKGQIAKMVPELTALRQIKTKQASITRLTSRGGYAISREYNLLSPSYTSVSELNAVLQSTALKNLGNAYIMAEKETGINAVYLLSKTAHESGWGKKAIGNNIAGQKAGAGWKGKVIIARTAEYDKKGNKYYIYGRFRDYSSKEECILTIAREMKKSYFTEGGRYFNGYTLAAVNRSYATDMGWSQLVGDTMRSVAKKIVKIRQLS